MKIDLSQFRHTFLQESADHIAFMETGLLELRSSPADTELLNSIFRSAHSIKGGAGSFGMENLVRFTHSLENLLDRLRNLEMQATGEVIDVLLRSVDVLRGLLEADTDAPMAADALELSEKIESLGAKVPIHAEVLPAEIQEPQRVEWEPRRYKIEIRPHRLLFESGTNPILLLRNLAALGKLANCQLHTNELPALADLDPTKCYLSWTVELASECAEEEIREVFEFVEHLVEIDIQRIEESQPNSTMLSLALVTRGPRQLEAQEVVNDAPADRRHPRAPFDRRNPDAPVDRRRPEAPGDRRVAGSPSDRRQAKGKFDGRGEMSSIRVATEKVDKLIDLVGELVIAHVMTAHMVEAFEPSCLPRLREAVAAMERNTRELHERVMSVRMLPVGTLFQRYTRTVYDIAQSTHKQIRLETSGEETEIDKSMLELLGDPLVHLIRNAADHGIEDPQVRAAAGKPEEGVITLRAFHRSGRIAIEISDDGAGIDTQKVRGKAIERGLIGSDAELSEDQLRMLLFEPGFSTRETISDLSGRGVGLDVVLRNVQQLNGSVSLASEIGEGSTLTIELPLTLAIMEGLLVRVGDRTLVLPLLTVIETVPLRNEQIVRVAERGEVVVIRDESIPLLRLSRFLGLPPETAITDQALQLAGNRRLAVIVEAGSRKIGLIVDELLGQQQVVVKSLERHLHKVDGLMGATILGDGCVAPIVDVTGLAAMNLFSLQIPVISLSQIAPPNHVVTGVSAR